MFKNIFKKKKHIKLGLYGPPNAGKTTLANKICQDWLGEDMGKVSNVAHETREIQIKEQITIKSKGKELSFNLVDTPGIATKVDFEEFIKTGMKEKKAKQRAKENGPVCSGKGGSVQPALHTARQPQGRHAVTVLPEGDGLEARDAAALRAQRRLHVQEPR